MNHAHVITPLIPADTRKRCRRAQLQACKLPLRKEEKMNNRRQHLEISVNFGDNNLKVPAGPQDAGKQ